MKDVLITIDGSQTYPDGERESAEFMTDGEYAFGRKGAAFTYMESPLTGLEGTKTTFLIRGGAVTMNRTGTVNSRMVFEEGAHHRFLYETPYGSATMGIETKLILSELGEHGGMLEIEYATDIENNKISTNRFLITIREQKERCENG